MKAIKSLGLIIMVPPIFLLTSCADVLSNSDELTLDQLPPPAREYMQSHYAGNRIVEVEREKRFFDKEYSFSVNFMQDEQEWEAEFDSQGNFLTLAPEDD